MVILVIFLSLFYPGAVRAQQCDSLGAATGEKMVERINKRYDDYFRYQAHLEERTELRNKGRGDNKKALKAHDQKIEEARLAYIKHRRPAPDTSDAEARAEEVKKQRLAKIEIARRCYVQQRTHAEGVLKRGRTIPENKEYDLED
jgi:hypothetical protein